MEILGEGHHEKPKIDYPCEWEYRLIGRSGELIQIACEQMFDKAFVLEFSHKSRTGKFISFNLKVRVDSEEERLHYYHMLNETHCIMQVL